MVPLLLTLALAGVLVGLAAAVRQPLSRLLARHLGSELQTAPDGQVDSRLRRIAQMGKPGIPVLIEALGSERTMVAQGAREVIWEEIARWESLPPEEALPRVALLADRLADQVAQFNPAACTDAACLAARILQWPLDSRIVAPQRTVAACERVLRLAGVDRTRGAPTASLVGGAGAQPASESGQEGALGTRPANEPVLANLAAESTTSSSGVSPQANPLRVPGPKPVAIQSSLSRTEAQAGAGQTGAGPDDLGPEAGATDSAAQALTAANRPARLPPMAPPSPGRAARAGDIRSAGGLGGVDVLDLMRRLHGDPSEAEGARSALAARGFSPSEAEIARRVFDLDPAVRRQLARTLPSVPGIDAAPWLLLLARDQDAEVRLTAMTLLATTGDRALLEEVRRIAQGDADRRIRDQLERLDGPQLGRSPSAGSSQPAMR
jgi:hypothetical protein